MGCRVLPNLRRVLPRIALLEIVAARICYPIPPRLCLLHRVTSCVFLQHGDLKTAITTFREFVTIYIQIFAIILDLQPLSNGTARYS